MLLGFLCKNLRVVVGGRNSASLDLNFLQNPSALLSSLRYISSGNKESAAAASERSCTVTYLINSFGLSPKSAISVSKRVDLKTLTKPDSVLLLLKTHGFSETQISKMVEKYPSVLMCNTEKTLIPKLDFFHSNGFSSSDVANILSSYPSILHRSLQNHIIPTFNFLNNLLGSEDKAVTAIKRCCYILSRSFIKPAETNIKFLCCKGVSESSILKFLYYWPGIFMMDFYKFKKLVEDVVDMGFNPSKASFGFAIKSLRSISKPTWENKVQVYKRWNLSEAEILAAFQKLPHFMTHSEAKIMALMDLFVNKLGWESSIIARNPALMGYSLEKRLIPRASVLQFLASKSLVDKNYRSANIFLCTEEKFLQNFVNCFDEAQELSKIYTEGLAFSR